MDIKPEVYEQLGTFYLGRGYDIDAKKLNDDLILYDSKDLVTHGVVLGMTGSGKTGLCLAVLEEAAMDGIPVIAIDPKGDIANLLLTFPNQEAKEFEPWVNEEDARKKGQDVPTYAAAQAEMWSKGLSEWGQGAARVKRGLQGGVRRDAWVRFNHKEEAGTMGKGWRSVEKRRRSYKLPFCRPCRDFMIL